MESMDLIEDLLRKLTERDRLARKGVAIVPRPEDIAEFVRLQRTLLGWKQDTLASFADVSLSTVQRIERGNSVSPKSLDRVAVALGYKPGDFTEPHVPDSIDEFLPKLERSIAPYIEGVEVAVRPLCTQPQVAELARTHCYLIDGGRIGDAYKGDIAALTEMMDFISFVLVTEEDDSVTQVPGWVPVKRRRIYSMMLDQVRELEQKSKSVALAGTYQVKTGAPTMPTADVALISFFPKATDPGAINRRMLFAPAQMNWAEAWHRFCQVS